MKEHHRVEVVRIEQVLPHPNADRLELVKISGYQAVVGKDQFRVGDLAYYIPPDSIVPDRPEFSFVWGDAKFEGGVPARKRRITARKFRKEWSEGLLMPCFLLPDGKSWGIPGIAGPSGEVIFAHIGCDFAEALGITHWETEDDSQPTQGGSQKKSRYPHSLRGWYHLIHGWFLGERREGDIGLPVYDVEAFKKHTNVFQPGEKIYVTEKIHGSNARYTFRKSMFGFSKFYAGSRNFWKALTSTCAWRRAAVDNPWIEVWCRTHPGYALYGEIVPTQKGYDYGQKSGKIRFFLFDVRRPDGRWMEMDEIYKMNDQDFGKTRRMDDGSYLAHKYFVPQLYSGPFIEETIKKIVDGPSTVEGATTPREGIVIKAQPERTGGHGLHRAQLKIVSNAFLERDSK